MNFIEAKTSIDSLSRFGSVLVLENIYELLSRLDNPQDKLKVIHVAGTNGKGSTIAYLSSILTAASYKTGKYTSPVVFEYLEKYQIDGQNISEQVFADIAQKVLKAVDDMVSEGKGQPTIFEVETAMAYLYFYESDCDVAIIETGMGGDMDATNVCSKVLASVIVSISLDHIGFLGDTIEEIARHKAGIIKRNCPVIIYGQSTEVIRVIEEVATSLNAPFVVSKTDDVEEYPFIYKTDSGYIYEGLAPSLMGTYQLKNLATVLEVVEQLKKQGFDIGLEAVKYGVNNAVWHGRFEKINDNPLFIIDGAHNPGAVRELRQTIERYYPKKKWIFIMGVLADKDFTREADMLSGMAKVVITVTPDNPRALPAKDLADAVTRSAVAEDISVAESVKDAVKVAFDKYSLLGEDAAILAFGSLSYLSKLRDELEKYVNNN